MQRYKVLRLQCFIFLGPVPLVDVRILTTPRIGEPLVLECRVTTVKDIAFRVDIEWRDFFHNILSNIEGVQEKSFNEDTEEHVNRYTVPHFSTIENGRNTYRCTGVINTDPPVRITSSVIVSNHGKLISEPIILYLFYVFMYLLYVLELLPY